jgi:hypothetical protein
VLLVLYLLNCISGPKKNYFLDPTVEISECKIRCGEAQIFFQPVEDLKNVQASTHHFGWW